MIVAITKLKAFYFEINSSKAIFFNILVFTCILLTYILEHAIIAKCRPGQGTVYWIFFGILKRQIFFSLMKEISFEKRTHGSPIFNKMFVDSFSDQLCL